MKVKDYRQLLKARGYKVLRQTKYQGANVYIKEHKYNVSTCTIIKDTHGKGQSIEFAITSQISLDPEIKKEINFDASYLSMEAGKIIEAFVKLKEMKAPKYIYF